MTGKTCTNCSERKNCSDSFISWIFFIVGLIATVAIRVVTVLIHLNPLYAKIAWYIGIGGFFAFFVYKYKVNKTRAVLIEKHDLVKKMHSKKNISENDYSLVASILCGLKSKKEMVNYIFIFGLSAVALVLAIYLDFLRTAN